MTELEDQFDPLDGKLIKPGTEYAEKDGIYFGSLQTQQMYYSFMERGFSVVYINGKPQMRPPTEKSVWVLGKSIQKGINIRSSSDCHFVIPGLPSGEYSFRVTCPGMFKNRGSKSINVSFRCESSSGRIVSSINGELSSGIPKLEQRVSVWEKDAEALCVIDFSTKSFLKSLNICSELVFLYSIPKILEEVAEIREKSSELVISSHGEFIVELTKGANGTGLTIGWEKCQKAVIVKKISDNSPASRERKLVVGSLIRGIQGQRVEMLDYKSVIKLIRSVPRTLVLIIEKNKEWEEKVKNSVNEGRVRDITDLKVNSASIAKKTEKIRVIDTQAENNNHNNNGSFVNDQERSRILSPGMSVNLSPGMSIKRRAAPARPQRRALPPRPSVRASGNEESERISSTRNLREIPVPDTTLSRNSSFKAGEDSCPEPEKLGVGSSKDVSLEKYYKMKKAGAPEGAIFNAWIKDECPNNLSLSFWSTDWQIEAKKMLGGEEKKKKSLGEIILENKETRATNVVANKPQTGSLLSDLKSFQLKKRNSVDREKEENRSEMEQSSQHVAESPVSKAAQNKPTVPATKLSLTDQIKQSGGLKSLKKVEKREIAPLEQNKGPISLTDSIKGFNRSKLAPIDKEDGRMKKVKIEDKGPKTPLQELKLFDRTSLRKAVVSQDSAQKASSPVGAPLKSGGNLQAALSAALGNIRGAVSDDCNPDNSSDEDDDWNDNDDWAM